jgi:soluble cytochrome b562
MSNANIVGILIENIKTDQELLKEAEQAIEEAKENKGEIQDRFKNYRKDLNVLMKYADEKHRKQIEELGFDLSESSNGHNSVAQIAFDII